MQFKISTIAALAALLAAANAAPQGLPPSNPGAGFGDEPSAGTPALPTDSGSLGGFFGSLMSELFPSRTQDASQGGFPTGFFGSPSDAPEPPFGELPSGPDGGFPTAFPTGGSGDNFPTDIPGIFPTGGAPFPTGGAPFPTGGAPSGTPDFPGVSDLPTPPAGSPSFPGVSGLPTPTGVPDFPGASSGLGFPDPSNVPEISGPAPTNGPDTDLPNISTISFVLASSTPVPGFGGFGR
ncbi:hypothetical protein EJ04DRAFT_516955 [Polyplosphaeria fusca]|uniref:Uncharacterized protein n=1 Tax=Polyplosphaeria fusca TaxID=682080 RepID=A0A9P4UWK9_9PLEO|nr:hypothetical protein EJ04DRAFT_516955 [Polyplosphaeria fusca]